ncbi:MAG: InlB B-repeat-containing protein [Mogibacterium sp.]|nr:InlB B-repeat-containing protein [Mogibacterium sp.]
MATVRITGNTISKSNAYLTPYADLVITDYPDHIEGYIDTYVNAKNMAGTYNLVMHNGTTYTGYVYVEGANAAYKPITRKTFSVQKTHSTQLISFSIRFADEFSSATASGSGSYTIPAKTSYTVSYNANGGSGAPGSQTKWYGENLTLQTGLPKKEGYTFKGWATSTSKAGQGTVDYSPGATYTSNAALALYAVWELVYVKPNISKLEVVRCKQNGAEDDEGAYARISFDWSIFSSENARYYGGSSYPYSNNSVSVCVITIGSFTITPTLTGTSGSLTPQIVGNGTFDTDLSYPVSVAITDSQQIASDHTTTIAGGLSTAFYPMDYNEDASAVGFFMPAPDDEEGAFFGKDVCCEKDILLDLDDTQASGTDHDLITAINALGWTDVFMN